MKVAKNKCTSLKSFFAVLLALTLIFSSIFPTITFAIEKESYNFKEEISKYNGNYEISTEPLGLEIGESLSLMKYVQSLGGDVNGEFIWLSEDSNIAKVNENGVVLAKKNGLVKIYGVSQGYNFVFDIIIKDYSTNLIAALPQLNDNPQLRAASGKFKVFVDPGHGGRDPGAIGPTGFTEAQMVLDVGLRLKSKLEAQGVIVETSRTTDVAIGPDVVSDLKGRADMANSFGADVFISIHNNSATQVASGTETYIHDSTGPGMDEARSVATNVQTQLVNKLSSINRGVKTADFAVLRETNMPAILAELEFISNPNVEAKMKTASFREQCAQALSDGIMQYLNTITIDPTVPVTGVTVSDKEVVLVQGKSNTVKANVTPFDATNKEVTWTSSNTNVATVSNNGTITAKSQGNAMITVTTKDGNFKDTINVNVIPLIDGYRLYGTDRYKTSYEVSKQGWRDGQGANVILASGEGYPDALCAVPLAKKYSAPILLTRKDIFEQGLKNELERLGTDNVIIVGGENVISSEVANNIKDMGINVRRIAGNTRYETSTLVAKEINHRGVVAVTTGLNYPDALSIASIAGGSNMPIILTEKENLSSETETFLSEEGFHRSYVIGGSSVISNNVVNKLPNPTRISGQTRYETNKNVIEYFKNDINFSNIYVAVGNNFPDALSAAALAGKDGSVIVLADSSSNNNLAIINAVSDNFNYVNNAYILGSSSIISDAYLNNNGITIK